MLAPPAGAPSRRRMLAAMLRSVLHISESDGAGGAAKTARSLHEGLRASGVDSRMLVGRKLTADPMVRPLKRNALWRAADAPFVRATAWLDLQYAFYPSSFGVATDRWYRNADVLQLHNLHGSFFSFAALPLLTRRPTVWWMQDMWPFTGHVAYSYDCDRWRHGCGSCPYLREYPALRRDRTHLLWRLKQAAYRRSRATVVTSSRWLDGLVAQSPLLAGFDRAVIPNGVDLDAFRPLDRSAALAVLGVADVGDAPTVLVFDGEERKGARLLPQLLARVGAVRRDVTVLLAGVRGDWRDPDGVAVRDLGVVRDEATLAAAYAAADVFVLPTLADNLPNALLESLACGTPVVGSDVGGIPDAVTHLENGYLARPGDAADAAAGVLALLGDPDLLAAARVAARRTAEATFGVDRQTRAFRELYDRIVAVG
jgi:glycosyltransferase involved in cell wall biosynthesis